MARIQPKRYKNYSSLDKSIQNKISQTYAKQGKTVSSSGQVSSTPNQTSNQNITPEQQQAINNFAQQSALQLQAQAQTKAQQQAQTRAISDYQLQTGLQLQQKSQARTQATTTKQPTSFNILKSIAGLGITKATQQSPEVKYGKEITTNTINATKTTGKTIKDIATGTIYAQGATSSYMADAYSKDILKKNTNPITNFETTFKRKDVRTAAIASATPAAIATTILAPNIVAGTVKVTAIGYGTLKGTEKLIIEQSKPTPFQYDLMKTDTFKEARQAGFIAEADEGKYTQIFKDVLRITRKGKKDTAQFEEGVKAFYESKGFTGDELKQAIQISLTERKGSILGETAALAAISTGSEFMGLRLVNKAAGAGLIVSKGKYQVLKTGYKIGKEIGKAGIAEGIATDITLTSSRNKPFSFKRTATAGALGGASAAILGGAIGATAAAYPKSSKVLLGAAYITDPFEPIGDYTEKVLSKAGSSFFKIPVLTPVLTSTPAYTSVTTQTSTKTQTPVSSFIDSITPVTTKTSTPVSTKTNIVSVFTPVTSNTPVSVTSNTPTPVTANIPSSVFTPVLSPVSTPVGTPVTSSIFTPVSTPVTVVVPTIRFPPIIPALPGGGGGNALFRFPKRGRGRSTTYIPSLIGLRSKAVSRKKLPAFFTGLEVRRIIK